jgi:catechol 2,3-dioxygenase-like lactoylglutathione lyase family enzyme
MPVEFQDDAEHAPGGPDEIDVEFGLEVRDHETSLRFWEDTLGFELFGKIETPNGVRVLALRYGHAVVKLRAVVGGSGTYAGTDVVPPTAPAGHYLTVHVADAREVQRACEVAGYTILTPCFEFEPADRPACVVGFVQDPDGHKVELLQGSPWTPVSRP